LLSTSEGGRNSPGVFPNYRPDLKLPNYDDALFGAWFEDVGAVAPGQTVEIDIEIRSAAELAHVAVGEAFTLVEGSRTIAECTVLNVYERPRPSVDPR